MAKAAVAYASAVASSGPVIVTDSSPEGGRPVCGSSDVIAAGVGAGRGDGEVACLDDGGHPVCATRVTDADVPAVLRRRAAADDEVASGVDRKVLRAGVLEDRRGTVDGPALDEAGGIETAVGSGVEVATRVFAELLAALQHVSHLRVRLLLRELATPDAADLALGLVRRERVVDEAQPVEDLVDGCLLHDGVADVDDDPHAHHVLDGGHTRRPLRSAICSDFSNATLVSVASEM